jgi:hypothetical protein
MGNLTGVAGGGSFKEQIKWAGGSTVAGTEPATTVPYLVPLAYTTAPTPGGIYRQGANVAYANLSVGAISSSGLYAVKVQHSNDDGVTDAYVDLASSTQLITGAAVSMNVGGAASSTDNYLFTDLRQARLWIRYFFTLTSGTGATMSQVVTLAAYDTLPTTDY